MKQRTNGIARWSVYHPVGVCMISLAVLVLGLMALTRLSIDLLPHIIYPEIRVRVADSGVQATVIEDQITRQLEEQLAITEDAIHIQSSSMRGLSTVDLSFEYGKDIDIALRDASTRLDRAKRFLPDSIDPPVIFKLDPAQIPVMEFVVSSTLRSDTELRHYLDHTLSKWFINLPGVAAAEVGGGSVREIQVIPDTHRLAALGLSYRDLVSAIKNANTDAALGRVRLPGIELQSQIAGRLPTLQALRELPIVLPNGTVHHLEALADVVDTQDDARILVRANGLHGIKLSIQKQPTANTTAVADHVNERLRWLIAEKMLPEDIHITEVADQSVYVRQSLNNASLAAISGALLAMAVVYLFLGNLRQTLIIGSVIPLAILFTCMLMGVGGLTLNIMTLGGLALGIGMLVDNTIVMLENIARHQREGDTGKDAAATAADEVNSAIIASTSTNLSAVLPFLFIGGLTGLLFQELIFTIAAAILASMVVALTLVPALAATARPTTAARRSPIDRLIKPLQNGYVRLLSRILHHKGITLLVFSAALALSISVFISGKEIFLPKLDDGRIQVIITADSGIALSEMDTIVTKIEQHIAARPEVDTVFTLVGGNIFGRSTREIPSRASLVVQLVPLTERTISSDEWMSSVQKALRQQSLAGIKIRMIQRGIRGIRTSQGDDDISLRLQGNDLNTLRQLGGELAEALAKIPGLKNSAHSAEEEQFELAITLDRTRAAHLGLELTELSRATRAVLQGEEITTFYEAGLSYPVLLKLSATNEITPDTLEQIVLFPASASRKTIYLGDVADIQLIDSPVTIMRDNQMRIVEITASLNGERTLGEVLEDIDTLRRATDLPDGYLLYDGGSRAALEAQQKQTIILLLLALFLVYVVMAVQYESLRNPLVIILSVPFAVTGVGAAVYLLALPLSMPLWLGLIMLTGIVVNNAILLVEYIEQARQRIPQQAAILEAARLRLRPILMTTLSTVFGMVPLAIGVGEGAEMLQPLAITVVSGLSYSLLVSLLLVPVIYTCIHKTSLSLPPKTAQP